jgi:hypothetical protein
MTTFRKVRGLKRVTPRGNGPPAAADMERWRVACVPAASSTLSRSDFLYRKAKELFRLRFVPLRQNECDVDKMHCLLWRSSSNAVTANVKSKFGFFFSALMPLL